MKSEWLCVKNLCFWRHANDVNKGWFVRKYATKRRFHGDEFPPNFYANTGIVQSVLNVIAIIYKCFCIVNEFRTLDTFCLKIRRFASFHNLLYIRWLWEISRKTKPWHVRRWCRFSRFILSSLSFHRLISGKLACDLRHFTQQRGSFFMKKWGELWFYPYFLSFYSVDDGLAKC